MVCRSGKVCGIKTGEDSDDEAMEKDDGFGLRIGGIAQVVQVTVGPKAADDRGAGGASMRWRWARPGARHTSTGAQVHPLERLDHLGLVRL